MPKKILRRFLPDPHKILHVRPLRWMGPLQRDPNLFHINRASISTSFFIGLFCAFLPIPGQTLVAALLALILRSNLPLAVALIWISNPLTITPMFLSAYGVGAWLLGQRESHLVIELSWDWAIAQSSRIWLPLLTGSLICGLTSGIIGYLAIFNLWRWQVIRNWDRRQKKRLGHAAALLSRRGKP
ncbi:DUF2062 domain-containing protein [Porticoccus sp.]|uniref:DUF2062 domain-containing protein n=1 Tax=Porticoccus sp. TaxID=2024853 RepID=UPI003F694EA2